MSKTSKKSKVDTSTKWPEAEKAFKHWDKKGTIFKHRYGGYGACDVFKAGADWALLTVMKMIKELQNEKTVDQNEKDS